MFSIKGHARRGEAGSNLMEMIVAVGIASLVFSLVIPMVLYAGKSFAGLANYVDMNMKDLNALDQLTRDIRQAVKMTSFATNSIVLDDGTNGSLTFTFTSSSNLIRVQGAKTNTLLTEVDSGQFAIYKHDVVSNSYAPVVAPDAASAKEVVVKWNSSRQIFGAKTTTDSGQTARIVIRKN